MSDWNNDQGGSAHPNTFEQENWTNSGQAENTSANNAGFGNDDFDNGDGFVGEQPTGNEKCFGCGETGLICSGHMRKNCEKPRKINRDHVADVSADDAWNKIKQAAIERDVDDAKEAVEEYIKAVDGDITYRQLQEALIDQGIGLWLIPTERSLIQVFTNMDLQGHIDKKYTISYRFVEQADRPRELEGWPKSRDELLSRLDDAGEVVDRGVPLCLNCKELGHISKFCTQEKTERSDAVKISCFNCGADGHRVRDSLVNLVTGPLTVRSPLTLPMSNAASATRIVLKAVAAALAATVVRRAISRKTVTSLETCPLWLAATVRSKDTSAGSVLSRRIGARFNAPTVKSTATPKFDARSLLSMRLTASALLVTVTVTVDDPTLMPWEVVMATATRTLVATTGGKHHL
uniref:CCHC-type domain-containing protein n=1 Tax=Fusarium oxysporum (strain Fo5176) TaxID=660025 RepID=A0A0D2XMT7_FUSOF